MEKLRDNTQRSHLPKLKQTHSYLCTVQIQPPLSNRHILGPNINIKMQNCDPAATEKKVKDVSISEL